MAEPSDPRLRVLERLARLEREELDRRRQELADLERALTELAAQRAALRRSRGSEIAAGWALPGGPAPLGAWLAALARRERALDRAAAELAERCDRARDALAAQRAANRRLEILVERERERERARRAERERKALDELATLRHPRARGGGLRTPERA